jgi:hypothetical protein
MHLDGIAVFLEGLGQGVDVDFHALPLADAIQKVEVKVILEQFRHSSIIWMNVIFKIL